jgi:sugar phosphate isomerase/epimerase
LAEASLSTMWMARRFDRLDEFMEAGKRAGFRRFELSHIVTGELLNGLEPGQFEISSLHAPCPNLRRGEDGLHLAALEREKRMTALKMIEGTIDAAIRFSASTVVVHMGQVDIDVALIQRLQRAYRAGKRETAAYRSLLEQITVARITRREAHFGAALQSLEMLVRYARERGVRLGLENRVDYHEIPSLEEMKDLLYTFDDGTVGYWHDTGHAHVTAALGFTPAQDWLRALGKRLFGLHLHDVQGINDHRVAGVGEVDFAALRPYLTPVVIPVCEFAAEHSPEEISAGREHLVGLGILSQTL